MYSDLLKETQQVDLDKVADKIQDLINIQANDPIVKEKGEDGNYFRGLANGLIVAKAVVDEKDPLFVNKDGGRER